MVVLLTESKFVDKAKEILDEVGPVVAYKASGKEAINEKKYKELRQYLRNPHGFLLIEAEAFNGMQARNILIIGGSSANVRNFIMRGISFVVFIQKEKHINTFINQEQSGNLQD